MTVEVERVRLPPRQISNEWSRARIRSKHDVPVAATSAATRMGIGGTWTVLGLFMPTAKKDLEWVRPPKQARSRKTQDRIVSAARRLLERGRSFEDVSVSELAAAAKASVGAFYNRFEDKEALLHVLQIELYAEGEETARAVLDPGRWAGVEVDVIVRGFVTLAADSYRTQRGLRRALLLAMGTNARFRERAAALTALTCEGLTRIVEPLARKRNHGAIRSTVDVCHRMVYGVLDQALLFDGGSPTGHLLADETLVSELTDACVGYLRRRVTG